MNAPADLTLVIPLRAKAGMALPDFYQDRGAITLAGVRGVAVADLIRRLGADSQRDPAVSALFLPA